MCVSILSRANLTQQQVLHLSARALAPIHACDNGPCKAWDQPGYASTLYAIVVPDSPMPIGILYANRLGSDLDVGWWVDIDWRRKKFSRPAVVAFADLLKLKYPRFAGDIRASIRTFGGHYGACALTHQFCYR